MEREQDGSFVLVFLCVRCVLCGFFLLDREMGIPLSPRLDSRQERSGMTWGDGVGFCVFIC